MTVSTAESRKVVRTHRIRHGAKRLLSAIAVLCMCIVLVTYTSYNEYRLAGYEAEIAGLRKTVEKSSSLEAGRVRREIASADEMNHIHDVQKRNAAANQNNARSNAQTQTTTFVRWGRRDCKGTSSKLVYSGLAAGTYYTHTGGGSNYICLDFHVDYAPGKFVEGGQGTSHLYGVEYRDGTWVNSLFDLSETENNALQYHSVPCSVCMTCSKLTQVMIPGRETCPDGWTAEYKGYIMAGSHSDKHPSKFICVDEQPQVVPGTSGSQTGSFLFMVETQCASLLCEPFVAGRELRCVVCSI